MRLRLALLFVGALTMFGAGFSHALQLNAIITDSDFPAPGPYRLEVLETGDTLTVNPGATFKVTLPRDTVWTLCVRKGIPPQAFEKCLDVKYTGRDSVFSARVGDGGSKAGGGVGVVVAEPGMGSIATVDTTGSGAAAAALAETPAAVNDGDAVRLQKVVLRAQRTPKRALGRETVSAKLIKRMPGLAEADVIRSIQGLPGVVASSDFSTKIYVRGGGSDQNLILFDNAPVFSPTHFFGLFSTFLVEGVSDVTFYKSGFPSEYGNRLSSVLDVQSRRGGKDTLTTEQRERHDEKVAKGKRDDADSLNSWFTGSSLKISTFATQVHTEGREGPVRWLLAGRTTYIKQVIDYFRGKGLIDLELDYYFYDVQGSMAVDLGQDRELLVSMYQGRDRLNFDPFVVDWGNTVVPVNLEWRLNNLWNSRTTMSYSLLSQSFGLVEIFEFYNNIATWQGKQTLEYSGIENHLLTVGLSSERSSTVFRNTQASATFRDATTYYLSSVFAQDKWTPEGGKWEVSPGARLNYMSTLNLFDVEPRLTIKRNLPHRQAIDVHAGRYVQYINSILFGDQESLNEFYFPAKKAKYRTVNPSTSWLAAIGYSKEGIFDAYNFSLEGYYKILDHLLMSAATSDIADSINEDPEAQFGDYFKEAEGYSYGYETSLRKPAGILQGGISYSSGMAVIREDNFDQAYYPKWHQAHSLKLDAAVNWTGPEGIWGSARKGKKAGRYFRSSSQIKYATGLPYTEVIGYQPSHLIDQNTGQGGGGPAPLFEDNVETVNGNYNMTLVPSYFRWDVKPVDWGREGKWNFSFTILNITNNANVFFYSYDRTTNPPQKLTFTQFPFFPLLMSYDYYF